MALAGFPVGPSRSPIGPTSAEQKAVMRAVIEAL
jgi:hypothetical protein